jgi:dipeptidyl aminopeptidase/acylaminoacyl peptidase
MRLITPWQTAIVAASLILGVTAASLPSAAVVGATNGKIVYVGTDGVSPDIYTMNADGSVVTNLTNDGRNNDDPEWSPDGTKIVWDTWRQYNNGNVWVMNADGSGATALTTQTFADHSSSIQATWSSDGGSIVFVRTDDELGPEIYRMGASGSNPTRLTTTSPEADDLQPSVAPTGRVAFASDRANTAFETFDIYVMNADGSGVRRLTFDGGDPNDPTAPSHDSLNPAWSPDGSRIAFDSTRDGNREVYVINADGTGLVNVSNDPSTDYAPAWSPDGTQLSFTSTRAGQDDIWTIDVGSFGASSARMPTAAAPAQPRNLTASIDTAAEKPKWQAAAACTIVGTARGETLVGTSGPDTICGGGGNDTVSGGTGADVIRGGAGADNLKGEGGNDEIVGGSGRDRLQGGVADDLLRAKDGVSGNDSVEGGSGNDDCRRDVGDPVTGCP